jgi:hypothetical protein
VVVPDLGRIQRLELKMTEHKNVFCALAAAQTVMGAVIKDAKNPHFNSKYADLASVVAACLPALNTNGIALVQYTKRDEYGRYMTTALVHGASDTRVECDVELIIGKNDMQGYKSATTYAKRIGLESVTGLAPEDDDGNAAAKNAPKGAVSPRPTVSTPTNGATSSAAVETPHDDDGVVMDENIPPPHPEPEEEENDPPSVTDFIDQVKERLAMAGNVKPTPEQISYAYGMAVIEKTAKRKNSARAKQWFDIFCDLHSGAIGKIRDEALRKQVRSAIALKGEMIAGKNPDPAEFGHPFGEDPRKRMPAFMGEGG